MVKFERPHVVAFDSKGNVYDSGRDNNSVPPEHIAIDKNDYIYIVDGASNPRVQKFFTNGTLVARARGDISPGKPLRCGQR